MYPAEDQRLSQRPIIHIAVQSDVERLPAFQGLPNQAIVMPASAEAFSAAAQELLACPCIGFDTESKPTFRVGEVSSGPHLIQFATPAKAYLLRVGLPGCIEAARAVLQAAQVVKIGFGLKSDRSRLLQRLGIHAHSLLDLGSLLRYQGKKGQVGLRGAVAAVLGRQIDKSRRLATSIAVAPPSRRYARRAVGCSRRCAGSASGCRSRPAPSPRLISRGRRWNRIASGSPVYRWSGGWAQLTGRANAVRRAARPTAGPLS